MATPTPTVAEVRGWLLSLLPPGAERIYSLAEGDGGIGDYFGAMAAAVKARGTDLVATLRREINPATADGKLPDWEAATGLSQSRISQGGTVAQRQAQLVSKLRESGASFLDNIRAAVNPYFDYVDWHDIQIIECDRSALTAIHTYAFPTGTIPALGTYNGNATVFDQEVTSHGGAHVWVNITHPAIQGLRVDLTPPSLAVTYTLADTGDLGTGNAVDQQFELWCAECEGQSVAGNWLLSIIDSSNNAGSVNVGGGPPTRLSEIFVEGVGREPVPPFGDVQGLGAQQFEFAVVFDPALSNITAPDLMGARAAVKRIQPAHTVGYVVQVMSGGSLCSIVDDASALVNGCLAC